MKRTGIEIVFVLICLSLISINSSTAATQRSLLIVCSADSSIESISPKEVRKLFLGLPLTKGKMRLRPLRNISDPSIQEVFLQKVIYMSKRSYKRRLLSIVFRNGGERPTVYSNIAELVSELKRSPDALSYMWSDQIEQHEGLKSIGALWTNQVD